jgi:MFS transporter, FHS family, L-fucose permease
MGYIADKLSFQQAYIFPALCYLYIFYYGWKGHHVKRRA